MTIDELLKSAMEVYGMAAAILARDSGEVVAMQPAYEDPGATESAARWAAAEIELARSVRGRTNEDEFVLPHPGTHHRPYTHVTVIGSYMLLLVFATDDRLPAVRKISQKVREPLRIALSGEGRSPK